MIMGQCHDTPLGHGQLVCEISRTNFAVRSYGLDMNFHYMRPRRYDLGSKVMTSLGHGKQLYEILSTSNLAVRISGPDMDFGHACTVTLTIEI